MNDDNFSLSENENDEDKKMFKAYAENELNIKNDDLENNDINLNEQENNINYNNLNEDNNFDYLNKDNNSNNLFLNEYYYPFPHVTKKLIGKKRLGKSKIKNRKDKIFIDYSFDNYLHNRINKNSIDLNRSRSNSISNISFMNLNLNELKNDFDELYNEVKNNKNLYLELQQSLVYLNSNDKKNFLDKTYLPLKKVLIQELKIENYKTDLFNYILEKSLIKNYFYTKTSIFEQREDENNNLNLQESLKPIEERNLELDENKIEDLNIIEKKDNLFVRKSTNKYYLSKKKVLPSIILVEKELKNIENVEKYINQENFFKIIENFIILSYNEKKYKENY